MLAFGATSLLNTIVFSVSLSGGQFKADFGNLPCGGDKIVPTQYKATQLVVALAVWAT
jgi:hypothetical protein